MKTGRPKKDYYKEEVILQKQIYYKGLSEKGKRHFLGQEYLHLSTGSQRYLSEIFGCSRHTIRKGASEIRASKGIENYSTQRKAGGGRKKKN